MNRRNIIFFDIDGTLLPEGGVVPESTKQAISQIKKNGDIAMVCTGRTLSFIPKEILKLDFQGLIAGAGTYCEYNRKVLRNVCLPRDKAYQEVKFLIDNHFAPVGEGPEHMFLPGDTEFELSEDCKKYNQAFRSRFPGTILELKAENIDVNKFTAQRLMGCNEEMVYEHFEKDYTIVDHAKELLEFIPKPFSKASGIELIIQELGIPRENTYAFGDGGNDLEMLDFVANGVAMGNATMDAKAHASYVTKDILDDGIFFGLKHFHLI